MNHILRQLDEANTQARLEDGERMVEIVMTSQVSKSQALTETGADQAHVLLGRGQLQDWSVL